MAEVCRNEIIVQIQVVKLIYLKCTNLRGHQSEKFEDDKFKPHKHLVKISVFNTSNSILRHRRVRNQSRDCFVF